MTQNRENIDDLFTSNFSFIFVSNILKSDIFWTFQVKKDYINIFDLKKTQTLT